MRMGAQQRRQHNRTSAFATRLRPSSSIDTGFWWMFRFEESYFRRFPSLLLSFVVLVAPRRLVSHLHGQVCLMISHVSRYGWIWLAAAILWFECKVVYRLVRRHVNCMYIVQDSRAGEMRSPNWQARIPRALRSSFKVCTICSAAERPV